MKSHTSSKRQRFTTPPKRKTSSKRARSTTENIRPTLDLIWKVTTNLGLRRECGEKPPPKLEAIVDGSCCLNRAVTTFNFPEITASTNSLQNQIKEPFFFDIQQDVLLESLSFLLEPRASDVLCMEDICTISVQAATLRCVSKEWNRVSQILMVENVRFKADSVTLFANHKLSFFNSNHLTPERPLGNFDDIHILMKHIPFLFNLREANQVLQDFNTPVPAASLDVPVVNGMSIRVRTILVIMSYHGSARASLGAFEWMQSYRTSTADQRCMDMKNSLMAAEGFDSDWKAPDIEEALEACSEWSSRQLMPSKEPNHFIEALVASIEHHRNRVRLLPLYEAQALVFKDMVEKIIFRYPDLAWLSLPAMDEALPPGSTLNNSALELLLQTMQEITTETHVVNFMRTLALPERKRRLRALIISTSTSRQTRRRALLDLPDIPIPFTLTTNCRIRNSTNELDARLSTLERAFMLPTCFGYSPNFEDLLQLKERIPRACSHCLKVQKRRYRSI
jgi:hypothetical protein